MGDNLETIEFRRDSSEEFSSDSLKSEVKEEKRSVGQKFTRHLSMLRQDSMLNLINNITRSGKKLKSSSASTTSTSTKFSDNLSTSSFNLQAESECTFAKENTSKGWTTIVTVVLVEAKGLPDPPSDGNSHSIYCKFQLGTEHHKSKSTPSSRQPKWGERFKFHLRRNNLLKISLWDKGKQKNFMGGCALDLSNLERERTNEIWQHLDDGFGSVHLSVTMCTVRNVHTTLSSSRSLAEAKDKYAWHNLDSDWKRVGQMHVKILGAKGLSGRPNAYSVIEVDNERVQTHSARASSEPVWNKSYMFNIYDMTSTLDVKVYDNSSVALFQDTNLGKVSIPLLKVHNGRAYWYALKDRSKKNSAKGNCPRVLLEITIFWNPIKSALRVFRPKEVKYIKKPTKFDIALVYSNVEFVKATFDLLVDINEGFKRFLEWENRELSFITLLGWLFFWFHFEVWMGPLLLLIPFLYFFLFNTNCDERSPSRSNELEIEKVQPNERSESPKTLTGRIHDLPEMTLVITNGIEYLASVAERLYNLATFKIPFLSYVAMIMLVAASVALYLLPFNYMLMAFGIYKFTRKYLNPERELNNDILDFLSRVPDNAMLNSWKQLRVPEPATLRKNSLSRCLSG